MRLFWTADWIFIFVLQGLQDETREGHKPFPRGNRLRGIQRPSNPIRSITRLHRHAWRYVTTYTFSCFDLYSLVFQSCQTSFIWNQRFDKSSPKENISQIKKGENISSNSHYILLEIYWTENYVNGREEFYEGKYIWIPLYRVKR